MAVISKLQRVYRSIVGLLEQFNAWLPPLFLRLILAWEFGEAGFEKLHGENWFANLTFPFPFNLLPSEFSWHLSTLFEIVGAFALALGLATRFFTVSLIVLTVVAIAAVHWPESWNTIAELWKGYAITNKGFGNYKLPLLYLIMLLPLLFGGAGKLSLDYLLFRRK
ncbi:MAG: DoxX family protein [Methylophilaceae bacterium]|jgi:putative oxidoreductase|nr:MAG: DoxX family protein [Methylophilaceae bacterium]